MNKALSRTFNLTAILFLLVWAPFFILTILDMEYNFIGQPGLQEVNFSLRCTLLILGSAKPVIYMICLKKFRMAIRYTSIRGVLKEMVKRKQPDTESTEQTNEGSAKEPTPTGEGTSVAVEDLSHVE